MLSPVAYLANGAASFSLAFSSPAGAAGSGIMLRDMVAATCPEVVCHGSRKTAQQAAGLFGSAFIGAP